MIIPHCFVFCRSTMETAEITQSEDHVNQSHGQDVTSEVLTQFITLSKETETQEIIDHRNILQEKDRTSEVHQEQNTESDSDYSSSDEIPLNKWAEAYAKDDSDFQDSEEFVQTR